MIQFASSGGAPVRWCPSGFKESFFPVKIRRTHLVGAVCVTVLISGGVWLFLRHYDARSMRFVDHWASLLSRCRNIQEVEAVAKEQDRLVLTRRFDSGEWVAVCSEHSCCSGAGFDATVFVDSKGTIQYDTTHSFCGYEGLCGELNGVAASNLNQFYSGVDSMGIRLEQCSRR